MHILYGRPDVGRKCYDSLNKDTAFLRTRAWHGCHYIPIRLIAISNVCPSKKDLNVLGRGQEKYASGDYINCREHHLLFSVIHGNMHDVVTCAFNGDKFLTTGKLWWQWWKSSFTCLQGSQSSKLTSTQFISCRFSIRVIKWHTTCRVWRFSPWVPYLDICSF